MAILTRGGEIIADVIRIARALVGRLMAGITRGRGVAVTVRMTGSTLSGDGRMRPGQRERRSAVIEGSRCPARIRGMAVLTIGRVIVGHVIGVVRALVIRLMTGITGRRSVVVTARMANITLRSNRHMGPGQGRMNCCD